MHNALCFSISLSFLALSACAQPEKNRNHVGGPCEGCEAVLEYGRKKLAAIDTLPDFNDPGPKLLVTGTIYQADGKTPARDVILYIYHTDQKGIYPVKGNETGWAKRHGYLRGWIKTKADGRYAFYTLRPASYPNSNNPQHIHPVIQEPGKNAYWIDEFLFADDPLLSEHEKSKATNRGGNGVLTLTKKDDLWIGYRDIILGLNIPNY
jgi:protocatechuate 3,4-dioxygenase beta subunit